MIFVTIVSRVSISEFVALEISPNSSFLAPCFSTFTNLPSESASRDFATARMGSVKLLAMISEMIIATTSKAMPTIRTNRADCLAVPRTWLSVLEVHTKKPVLGSLAKAI